MSGIITPKEDNQILQRIEAKIERLNDKILYAQNLESVKDITQTRQRKIDDLRNIREFLEPVQKAIGQEILSSAMILTPEKMRKALIKNPWEVLVDIQPVNLAVKPNNPHMVLVLFRYNDMEFLGWQMRGSLPMLFNCEYEELWQSDSDKIFEFEVVTVKKGWFGKITTNSTRKTASYYTEKLRCNFGYGVYSGWHDGFA